MMEKISVMISEEDVDKRIREIGEEITKKYQGKEVLLICVLRGGSFFMCELAKRINLDVKIDFMSVSSYGGGTESSGHIKIIKDLEESVEGRNVIVVEDIIDSGRTLSHLMNLLKTRQPASLALCALLDKPDRRVVRVDVDYTGFKIPDYFVVGYGLDYDQKYRNLPFIGKVEIDNTVLK
ncbi:MAG: hypoxanthine phosphoribosyltransferase [Lachnospiraceae bacterium]|nr:hypoxanthine phosphoribosyltransferase [Lachnospiraceae bacterium]